MGSFVRWAERNRDSPPAEMDDGQLSFYSRWRSPVSGRLVKQRALLRCWSHPPSLMLDANCHKNERAAIKRKKVATDPTFRQIRRGRVITVKSKVREKFYDAAAAANI